MGDISSQPNSYQGLTFLWLGAAGLAFQAGGCGLLVDPFFTRPPVRALLTMARVSPNPALVARYTPPADYLLVTHAHYDHLLDAPEVLRLTNARAYGSANTCALLRLLGLPGSQMVSIQPGDRLELGPFIVEVFPGYHTRTPLDHWINGPLPGRLTGKQARLPLRLVDYRMDTCCSFRIRACGQTVLVGSYPIPASTYFTFPYQPGELLRSTLQVINPRWIIPIHWDDFTRPLSRPLRPMLVTRWQGLRGWLPVRRLDLPAFAQQLQMVLPETMVMIPGLFEEYRIEDGDR